MNGAAVLFGPLPVWVLVSGQPAVAGLLQLDDRLISLAARRRLLADKELSGRPLYLAVSSMPQLSHRSPPGDYETALEWALELITLYVTVGVRSAFLGAGLRSVAIDDELGRQLQRFVTSLRFCATCGAPFTRSRRLPRTCGKPECRQEPAPRKRPGQAANVAASRWRHFLKDAIPTLKAQLPDMPDGDQRLEDLLERYRRDDLNAEQILDDLADTEAPALRRIIDRASRYRTSQRKPRTIR